MHRLTPGVKAPTLDAATIGGVPVSVPDRQGRLTHIQFRRFAGCPVCNLHLMSMARRHAEIREAGVHQIVLFHSNIEEMAKYQAQLPFDCVADPRMDHYRRWRVEPSFRALLHPRVLWSGARWVLTQRRFYRKAENGILGLPADFLVDQRGIVLASKYGEHADDQWEVEDVLRLARGPHTSLSR